MKTRAEMVYDFMLALCPTLTPDEIAEADDNESAKISADFILIMAKALTETYLESL
jgi:hypothetical protein